MAPKCIQPRNTKKPTLKKIGGNICYGLAVLQTDRMWVQKQSSVSKDTSPTYRWPRPGLPITSLSASGTQARIEHSWCSATHPGQWRPVFQWALIHVRNKVPPIHWKTVVTSYSSNWQNWKVWQCQVLLKIGKMGSSYTVDRRVNQFKTLVILKMLMAYDRFRYKPLGEYPLCA